MIHPDTPVRLRPDAVVQPLVHQWYAWGHLISPVTAALNVAGRHVKLMRSFLQSPQIHIAAARNPKLAGGPFMNLSPERMPELSALLQATLDRQAPLLELASAIGGLTDLLASEARGSTLAPLYARVPAPLRGYVELFYDLENRPGFRLLEPLLYRSRFYQRELQSLYLTLPEGDDRPFVLSTPALPQPGAWQLNRPFDDAGTRALLETMDAPLPFGRLREALGLSEAEAAGLERFLTESPPVPAPRFEGPGVRVRYFGHACLLFETAETSILTDPIVSYAHGAPPPRFTLEDLPARIDYVLLTHHHKDHFLLETLLRLRHRIGHVLVPHSSGGSLADPSMRHILRAIGFPQVHELDELDEWPLPGGCIRGIPFLGEHGDLDIRSKLAFLIELGGHKSLIAADSTNLEPALYQHLRSILGRVDTLFLSLECEGAPFSWLYGCLLPRPVEREHDQLRRLAGCDDAKALALVEALGCQQVYIYAMGQEPWLKFLTATEYGQDSLPIQTADRLVRALRTRSITAERWFGKHEWSPHTESSP